MSNEQKEIIRQGIEKYLTQEDRILPSHYPTLKRYRMQLVEEAGLLEFIIEDVQPQTPADDIDAFLAEITNTSKVPAEKECGECFGLGAYEVHFRYGTVEHMCEKCGRSGLKEKEKEKES
jgi:hypothetical protein